MEQPSGNRMVSIGGEIVDKIGTPAKYIEQYSQVIQHQHSDIAVHDVRNGKKGNMDQQAKRKQCCSCCAACLSQCDIGIEEYKYNDTHCGKSQITHFPEYF
ncbi:MAG: hypothetical protein ACLT3Y_03570 [Ruminococcus callidus]